MNRITFSREGEIRPAAVVLVGLVLSALAFAIDSLIAGSAAATFGTLGEVPALGLLTVAMMSVPAVLGNALGFYMSYRRYDPRALLKFLAPAAGFYAAFMVPHAWGLLAGGTFAAFALAATLSTIPVAIAVPALLALRPEPETAPDDFRELRAEPAAK